MIVLYFFQCILRILRTVPDHWNSSIDFDRTFACNHFHCDILADWIFIFLRRYCSADGFYDHCRFMRTDVLAGHLAQWSFPGEFSHGKNQLGVLIIANYLTFISYWYKLLLLQATGISVEFCSHIVHAYLVSTKKTREKKATEALSRIGSSVRFVCLLQWISLNLVLNYVNHEMSSRSFPV